MPRFFYLTPLATGPFFYFSSASVPSPTPTPTPSLTATPTPPAPTPTPTPTPPPTPTPTPTPTPIPGVKEITVVGVTDDVAGSHHNSNFIMRKASNVAVAIVLNGGSKIETTTIDCTGVDFTGIYAGTVTATVIISDATKRYGVWISGGVIPQTEPDLSAFGVTDYIEAHVDFSSIDPVTNPIGDNSIAARGWIITAFRSGLSGGGIFTLGDTASETFTATDPLSGERIDAISSAGDVTVTVSAQGRNAASAVGGMTNLAVNYTDNEIASTIAGRILTEANGQGWDVNLVDVLATLDGVRFTDQAEGVRTDAVDGSPATGFSFSIEQQGVDPIP